MGKPTICIGENEDADQLRGNREADQRLCFRYSDSLIPLLFKLLAIFCACTGRFLSDLFGNHFVGLPKRRLKCNVRISVSVKYSKHLHGVLHRVSKMIRALGSTEVEGLNLHHFLIS